MYLIDWVWTRTLPRGGYARLLAAACLGLALIAAAPAWCQEWDYMAEREKIESGMTDAERHYVRAHAQTRESTSMAFREVYQYRRINRTYEAAGQAKTFVGFVLVAMTDVALLVASLVALAIARRWWLATPLAMVAAAAIWAAFKSVGPWDTWSQLALSAHVFTGFLITSVLSAAYKLLRPAHPSAQRRSSSFQRDK